MAGLVTEIGEKAIEINGQKQNGFFATLSDEVIKPAVIRYNAHITAEENTLLKWLCTQQKKKLPSRKQN